MKGYTLIIFLVLTFLLSSCTSWIIDKTDENPPNIDLITEGLIILENGTDEPDWTKYFSVEDIETGTINVKKDMVKIDIDMDVGGLYPLTITVRDKNGNESTLSVDIYVITEESCFEFDSLSKTITGFTCLEYKNVIVPKTIYGTNVDKIGYRAFYNVETTIDAIILQEGVKEIKEEAFFMSGLFSIVIPASVTFIGEYAFLVNNFRYIEEITIYGEQERFNDIWYDLALPNYLNTKYDNYDGFIFEKETNTIIDYDPVFGSDITIPRELGGVEVLYIGDEAFRYCELTSVIIQNNIISIGEGSFSHNYLTEIMIPESVTEIGMHAFMRSTLKRITLNEGLISIGDSAFYDNNITYITIPDSVIYIGITSFASNKISRVVIPENVEYIGYQAFSWNLIQEVTILGIPTRFNDQWERIGFPFSLEPVD